MKAMMILCLAFPALTACDVGDFCDLYEPVFLDEGAARAQVAVDRGPAESIALNNETYLGCP